MQALAIEASPFAEPTWAARRSASRVWTLFWNAPAGKRFLSSTKGAGVRSSRKRREFHIEGNHSMFVIQKIPSLARFAFRSAKR